MPIAELNNAIGSAFTFENKFETGKFDARMKHDIPVFDDEVGQYWCLMNWSVAKGEVKVVVPDDPGNGIYCAVETLNVSYGILEGGRNMACVGPFSGCVLRVGRDDKGRPVVVHVPRSAGEVRTKHWDKHRDKNKWTELANGSWDSQGVVDTSKKEVAYAFIEVQGDNVKKCILKVAGGKVTGVITP